MLKLSILAVDDSPVITEMISDAFESEGYKVMKAHDGAEALKIALQHHPDLIIADIAMPGMDGWELCSQIRSNPFTSFIPFIFLTHMTEAPDRIKGLQMGADDYLTKPFEMEELIARVQLIFQRMRKSQESMITRQHSSLSGSTSEMALPDLLQMFGLNQKTGLLQISKIGFPNGEIAVESGRIIAAGVGKIRGQKALFRLLRWEDAQFEVAPLMDHESDPDLSESIEQLLLEGMRQIDELAHMEKDLSLSGKRIAVKKRPPQSEMTPREQELFKVLESGKEMTGILDALPWTDYEVYRMVAHFIKKGALEAL